MSAKGWSLCLVLALAGWGSVGFTQSETDSAVSQQVASSGFNQAELDQMLAPVALYPDSLLSQILMAATYPLEVVEAARWSRDNPALRGDDAVRAIQQNDWDPSVKSLVAFPPVVQMMGERLRWTERLGEAFLAQEAQVMDTVQSLRGKAYATGYLHSSSQMVVENDDQLISILPADPGIVYVPYYDPAVVYGAWWWPDYPPVYWAAWPDYDADSGLGWGTGIVITVGFFFGNCDWHHHHVRVVNVNNFYYSGSPPGAVHAPSPGVWHHDPYHRRGVSYRDPALHERFERADRGPEMRHEAGGGEERLERILHNTGEQFSTVREHKPPPTPARVEQRPQTFPEHPVASRTGEKAVRLHQENGARSRAESQRSDVHREGAESAHEHEHGSASAQRHTEGAAGGREEHRNK